MPSFDYDTCGTVFGYQTVAKTWLRGTPTITYESHLAFVGVLEQMRGAAAALGADAIVGASFSYRNVAEETGIANSLMQLFLALIGRNSPDEIEVFGFGTAVKQNVVMADTIIARTVV